MSALSSFRKWLALKRYQFEVTFSVYMFTPWEKFFFNSLLFLLVSLTFIAACLYLPHHISFLINRAWYYINGEHIDVAEVAKDAASEVLKEISTGLTHPTAETVVREL